MVLITTNLMQPEQDTYTNPSTFIFQPNPIYVFVVFWSRKGVGPAATVIKYKHEGTAIYVFTNETPP